MGASRKLQGEIDRVLKKVQEGVDVFDSIWNKVYGTDNANANQKEKFEADLKKEIKKLQSYRDQIKTWIQSSEIEDKKVGASYEQALVDARKLIEREMERFKACEKETKTKAFSKEGLGQQPKTDPKEKAKSETRDWLNNVVGELESQIDNFKSEMESLSVKKGKTQPPRLTHLETSIARHKAHIMKLELILRLLDNDELSAEHVNDVKDFLEDYVERNQEDFEEFSDVDEFYSALPLDKVESLEDLVTMGQPGLAEKEASMADKPSRALVLFGYGVAPHITPSHSHFHAVASRGCCGFLAFEDSSPTPGVEDEKLIRELAQLLDANESFFTAVQNEKDSGSEASKQVSSIKERFMGMRAALVTSSHAAKCFGEKLGFSILDLQSAESAADELLELLGFQNEKIVENHQFDLVFVHIGAYEGNNAENNLENANNLVGRILQVAQPGSEIASRLHLTLIMSYGTVTVDDPNLSLESLHDGNNSDLQSLFPRQSYTLKGVNPRNDIRRHCPALIAQWQDAVTRKDVAQEFSFSEFRKNCGNLAIAADRFIYETAFKLWKAPKYGA